MTAVTESTDSNDEIHPDPETWRGGPARRSPRAWILLLVVTFALSSDTFFAPPPEQASCGDVANVDDDRYQLGIVVIITGGLMGFAATCFSVLYWCFRFDPLKDHTPPRELTVKGTSYA